MAPVPDAEGSAERFRRLMARWATGVSVVTARDDGGPAGLTVNAFLSVSLVPPVLLVSVATDTDTLPVVERSGRFAVNVLGARQRALSERFARRVSSAEKFAGVPVHPGATGLPLLDGTLAAFECRLERALPAGDHRLLLGEVVAMEEGPDAPPLVFFRSGYAALGPDGRLELPPAPPERR